VLKVFNSRPKEGKLHVYMRVLLLRDTKVTVRDTSR
jgi:hypothetical protein